MVQLIKAICLLKQEYAEMNEKWKERFDGLFNSVIQRGECMAHHLGLITARANEIVDVAGRAGAIDADDTTAEEMKASFILSGANNSRHKNLLKNFLEDQYTCGDRTYTQDHSW